MVIQKSSSISSFPARQPPAKLNVNTKVIVVNVLGHLQRDSSGRANQKHSKRDRPQKKQVL